MSWSDPCSNCGQHRADCDCGDWNGYNQMRKTNHSETLTPAQEILQLQEDCIDLSIEHNANCEKVRELQAANKALLQQWLTKQSEIKKLMHQHDRQNSTRSV